jgi:hypothetical protein
VQFNSVKPAKPNLRSQILASGGRDPVRCGMPAFAVMISAVVLVSIAENLAAAASGGTALLHFGELVARSHRFFGPGDCRREGSSEYEDGQDEFPQAPSFHKKTI